MHGEDGGRAVIPPQLKEQWTRESIREIFLNVAIIPVPEEVMQLKLSQKYDNNVPIDNWASSWSYWFNNRPLSINGQKYATRETVTSNLSRFVDSNTPPSSIYLCLFTDGPWFGIGMLSER